MPVPRRRIISFLPSATEMAFALGLGEDLVGVTHECDFPPEAKSKPAVVHPVLPIDQMTQREIDEAASQRLRDGLSLYAIDEDLVRELAPDLIITQNLCEVCAPSGNEVGDLLAGLPTKPEILWMTPRSLTEIEGNIRGLGAAAGRSREAERLIAAGRARLHAIEAVTRGINHRPRVFCMEWLDPVFCGGHWMPEMVKIAGGVDSLSRDGTDSVRIPWEEVLTWAPEVLVVAPCGFGLDKVVGDAERLASYPGWADLPAVRGGKVYAVDANAYFARPGPRIVDGTELLAHLIHPELFASPGAGGGYERLGHLCATQHPSAKQR
jgi:iron complex transport system substrate-binding protein